LGRVIIQLEVVQSQGSRQVRYMGVLSHLLVADASEADAVAASNEPSQTWDGFFCHGLDRIKLVTLWALLEAGSADDKLEHRLDTIRTIPEGDHGPWVDIVPPNMLGSLASIVAMEEDEQESLAERWGHTVELERWEASEVLDLLRSIGDTAESALLVNKTLLIWTSL
jgi:hypothetical protein